MSGFYLKSLGAAEWRIDPDWIAHNADILDGADYPFEPRAIGPGTLLILYATGFQKVFGVAEVTTDAYPANRHPRWPWRCDHRILLAVDHLDDAPPLTGLNVPGERDLRLSVRQRPYVELKQAEFELGMEAFATPGALGHRGAAYGREIAFSPTRLAEWPPSWGSGSVG